MVEDVHERAARLMRLLIDVPAERFTLGELLFICNRFRDTPDTDGPVPVGAVDLRDVDRLEGIARRLVAEHGPEVH